MIKNNSDIEDNKEDEITRLIYVPYKKEKITYELASGVLIFMAVVSNGVRVWLQI